MEHLREIEYADRIASGMEVRDADGAKVGTVARTHRRGDGAERQTIVEVKTGFLGRGRHLYVPLREVRALAEGCLYLPIDHGTLDGLGWDERPPDLEATELPRRRLFGGAGDRPCRCTARPL